MEKKVDVKKIVFNKAEYQKIIDTEFNELGVTNITDDIQSTVTVNDFFNYYNELFYEIPERGGNNSHEYLIRTSGDYINFEEQSDIIEALQEEINVLRETNLKLETELIEAKTGQKVNLTPTENDLNNLTTNQDIMRLIGGNEL
jgi:hypothetical protein